MLRSILRVSRTGGWIPWTSPQLGRMGCQRTLSEHKLHVLRAVEFSPLGVKKTLKQLRIPPSTYCRWRRKFRGKGLVGLRDRPSGHLRVWNRLLPEERERALEIALLNPDWSPPDVGCFVTDHCGFTISESSVYRILKSVGLIGMLFLQRLRLEEKKGAAPTPRLPSRAFRASSES